MTDLQSSNNVAFPDANGNNTSKLVQSLLESAKNLPSSSSELGSIQLSVNEVRRRVSQLRSKKPSTNDNTGAYYLLAGDGLVLEDINSVVNELKGQKSKRPRPIEIDNEIVEVGFTNREEDILSSIEKQLLFAAHDFDNSINKTLKLDWSHKKQKIEDNFRALIQRRKQSKHVHHSLSAVENAESTLGLKTPTYNINSNYDERIKFEQYAKIIEKFNQSCLDKSNHSTTLLGEMLDNFQKRGLNNGNNLQFMDALSVLVDHQRGANYDHKVSMKYLESELWSYIVDLGHHNYNSQLLENTVDYIKIFIDKKLKNHDGTWKVPNLVMANEDPLWMIAFYLLRSGHISECIEYLNSMKTFLKKIEQPIITYLKAKAANENGQLTGDFLNKIQMEYNQHIKSSIDGDPYRNALYRIVGRCDLSRKNFSSITFSIEDWLWLHLCLVTNEPKKLEKSTQYCLSDLQNLIVSYGSNKFANSYLKILVLTGLYENAADFAFALSSIDAIHFALFLKDNCLLKLPPSEDSISTSESGYLTSVKDKYYFNTSRMLADYIDQFKFSDPRVAAQYIIHMKSPDSVSSIELCKSFLENLVLDTREYALLLGKVNEDGSKLCGLIEKLYPLVDNTDPQDFILHVADAASRRTSSDSKDFDNIQLYMLLNQPGKIFDMLNKQISDVLSATPYNQEIAGLEDFTGFDPILLAYKLINSYKSNSEQFVERARDVCVTLTSIFEIKGLVTKKLWTEALNAIKDLDIIPLKDEVLSREKANEYPIIDSNIAKCIPNLLVLTMLTLKNKHVLSGTSTSDKNSYIEMAKSLMVYAGLIQYKMPRDTYAILNKYDISRLVMT
ncbi:uncharacterized protein GVI51_F02013 [Nakaseomyces glabratus]|uniref:Nuclear pore protein n=1 Tax=Candida glabrata (strain ATCC 2001 / BCRC 20586 / JCM 3761 / NBRC 0622 / NRRL Y-65 / CBS 138) TaxID=284593 RepID=Q6FUM4_CANGA|nr:uncharacterized protein CAGL0F02277g [Nakaseomyces glabratus]KAI8398076.1 Nup93/Nic96 [Nakaseomyces glabratus]KAJ9572190.1 nuclear pore complex subunit [Nakaseomyces glabratus]QHS65704.1 uncharacterized protein GVI51_F02013 [Nakaseomyces glabratus]UCS20043.1 uncharacterized protein GW608_F01991 [Nakaseomyces glabratus]UCS25274.1 uncharacterized protein HLK63_F01991 [Nakaseomyces glabratus]|eukprot:XP_446070.1 uncharacterized protein CAGL0F02277g [[Candida] glabrata]